METPRADDDEANVAGSSRGRIFWLPGIAKLAGLAIGVAMLVSCATGYNEALQNAADPYDERGTAYLNQGDWTDGRAELFSAIAAMKPGTDGYYGDLSLVYTHTSMLARVGYSYGMQGDFSDAKKFYDQAVSDLATGTRRYNELAADDATMANVALAALSGAMAGMAMASHTSVSIPIITIEPGTAATLVPDKGITTDGVRFVTFGGFKMFGSIGRITTPTGWCTGTLVGYKLVLTAAHCVTNETDGSPLMGTYRFWPSSEIPIEQEKRPSIEAREIYTAHGRSWDKKWSDDWAFLVLASHPHSPLDSTRLPTIAGPDDTPPIAVHRKSVAADGAMLAAGYSHDIDQGDFMSVDWGCRPLGIAGTVIATDCAWNHGASGGPVFVIKNGSPTLLAVISNTSTGPGPKRTSAVMSTSWIDELYRLRAENPLPKGLYSRASAYCRHDPADCL